jgi:AcrR family transcriptional regulator
MARPATRSRVHDAAIALVRESGYTHLTIEGIAARAGVGKQTLYRTWPSTAAILCDALLSASLDDNGLVAVPDTGDLAADLHTLVVQTLAELADPTFDRLLRAVTAELQTDEELAAQLRVHLLEPQLRAVGERMARAGVAETHAGVELLFGPIFHRWLLRTGTFEKDWADDHVARVLLALGVQRPRPDDPESDSRCGTTE